MDSKQVLGYQRGTVLSLASGGAGDEREEERSVWMFTFPSRAEIGRET